MNCLAKFNQKEQQNLKTDLPVMRSGNIIHVFKEHKRIFSGTLIAIKGKQINRSLQIYDDRNKIKVQRHFFVYDPTIRFEVEKNRRLRRTRRARLYYLLDR